MPDSRDLSDRELLLRTYERVERIDRALYGNGQRGLIDEVAVLQTKVAERTTSKRAAAGVSGLTATLVVAILEFIRRYTGLQ